MKRRNGTPAAAVLAGGISRHGAHCLCLYCKPAPTIDPDVAAALNAGENRYRQEVLGQGPLPGRETISSAFAAARSAIADLEAKRVEHVGGDWSPSQHARAA